jgi:hypothetical protein
MDNLRSNPEVSKDIENVKKLKDIPIHLTLDGLSAFTIIAQIQLALRHPKNRGESANAAREIARHLEEAIASVIPALGITLEKGWHPENDVKFPPCGYRKLDIEYQAEIIVNCIALQLACSALSEVSGKPRSHWADAIGDQARNMVDAMTDESIARAIEQLETMHNHDGTTDGSEQPDSN